MKSRSMIALSALALGACVGIPQGPGVMVLPGSQKGFDEFAMDDRMCRGWAGSQTGLAPAEAANRDAVTGAVVGAGVGAAAGALIGAASHEAGPGAAIGAGAGLLLGSAAGASAGEIAGTSLQRRYDIAYTQCMYAKGNRVPVPRGFVSAPGPQQMPRSRDLTGRRPSHIPRPPAGPPPPPPPGAE